MVFPVLTRTACLGTGCMKQLVFPSNTIKLVQVIQQLKNPVFAQKLINCYSSTSTATATAIPTPTPTPKPKIKEAESNVEKAVRFLQSEKASSESSTRTATATATSTIYDSSAVFPSATPTTTATSTSTSTVPATTGAVATTAVGKPKKSLWERVKEEAIHYYNGFKLLGIETRITFRLLRLVTQGHTLTRREKKQLVRTASDMLRMVPFLVFIIVPFMEFLLPFALKLFPNMLPSTFQDSMKEEENMKKLLKVRIEMAKFLQKTVEEMAVSSNTKENTSVEEFARFFDKIRSSGRTASNEEILKFSKLFENEITLDHLSKPQLSALCKSIGLPGVGTNSFLIFQLKMKLRQLRADDLLIESEGLNLLTSQELQMACQARGMRAIGLTRDQLQRQLKQWIDLHIHENVPASLLLLSQALFVTEAVPSPEQIEATLKSLPKAMVSEAEVQMAEIKGEKISNKTKLEVLKAEEAIIAAEKAERLRVEKIEKENETLRQEKEKLLAENAPLIGTLSPEAAASFKSTLAEINRDNKITVEELQEIRDALSTLSADSALTNEKQELEDLKEDREEYKEDLAELRAQTKEAVKEDKASSQLGKRIESMITKLEKEITSTEAKLSKARNARTALNAIIDEDRDGKISWKELQQAFSLLKNPPSEAKIKLIAEQLDVDKDGKISVEEITLLADLLEDESDSAHVDSEQLSELILLLNKENTLEDKEEVQEQFEKERQEKAKREKEEQLLDQQKQQQNQK